MKTKNKIALILAVVFQIAVLTGYVSYSFRIMDSAKNDGKILTLSCTAYDPYNPLRGRYLRVSIQESNELALTQADYYLQENLANKVDSIRTSDFNSLKPELELYVDSKGRYVQKGMTVLESGDGARISIEEYLQKK